MKYPTLRYPRLCRLLTYVVVLGAFLLPVLIVLNLSFIPSIIKIIVFFGCFCALLGYLFREFPVLMMLDINLAFLSCYHTARTQYKLRAHNTVLRTERKVSRYGTKCTPVALLPQPTDLRYQFSSPWTIFSRGIERVVAAYHTDMLDTETYRTIFSSALTNSKSLVGHKKARFLDRQQKKAALHRVTVIIIYAKQVAPSWPAISMNWSVNKAATTLNRLFFPAL